MGKKAQVLLLKPLLGTGNAGDIVDVKIHYANQVLIPQGVAIYYDKQVKNQREAQMKKVEKNKADQRAKVESMVKEIAATGFVFEKQATDEGKLYDSISSKTLVNHLMVTYQIVVSTESFTLEEKIDTLGEYEVPFTYEEIETTIPVKVVQKVEA